MEKTLEMLEEKMEEHLRELGLKLADIEYVPEGGYNYLRIYVEKPDGNTSLDDCVELSTRIDGIADELIKEKTVKINGEVLENLAYTVNDDDEVELDGRIISDIKVKKYYYYKLFISWRYLL